MKRVRCAGCKELKIPSELTKLDLSEDIREVPYCQKCIATFYGEAVARFLQAAAKGLHCSNCGAVGDDAGSNNAYLVGREVVHGVCNGCKSHLEDQSVRHFAKRIVDDLCNELNGGDHGKLAAALADAMNRQHRYLQGEVFTMLFKFFALYSKHEHDARNEWAVKIAGIWERCVGRSGNPACEECNKVFK